MSILPLTIIGMILFMLVHGCRLDFCSIEEHQFSFKEGVNEFVL